MKTPWWFLYKTPLAILLLPVSFIYFFISKSVFLVRKLFVYKSRRTVICVGNILAGGVGKTPIVREIAKFFDAPIVMRGYKQTENTDGAGDEALMLARDGLQVHTGDRKSNVCILNKQENENSPIIMDDGFQNPRIKKDLSILVFDEKIGVGNGFLLPAGPLREGMRAAARADAIIVVRSRKNKKKMNFPHNVPVFFAQNKTVSPYPDGECLFAFAGIGYPKKFFSALKNVKKRKSFPDHYQYTDDDIKALRTAAARAKAKLITTEKDWVRLSDAAKKKIKYAHLETVIDKEFFVWLKEKVSGSNK